MKLPPATLPQRKDIKKVRRFKNVISYIEQNYRKNITLEELANECGMNRNYFCRAFEEYTGKQPRRQVTDGICRARTTDRAVFLSP